MMFKHLAMLFGMVAIAATCLWTVAGAQEKLPPPSWPPITSLETARLQMQLELKTALQEFGPEHPKVKTIRIRLEEVEKSLTDQASVTAGRYAVAASSLNVVLVDTRTGLSWYLRPGKAGEEPAWAPLQRKE